MSRGKDQMATSVTCAAVRACGEHHRCSSRLHSVPGTWCLWPSVWQMASSQALMGLGGCVGAWKPLGREDMWLSLDLGGVRGQVAGATS